MDVNRNRSTHDAVRDAILRRCWASVVCRPLTEVSEMSRSFPAHVVDVRGEHCRTSAELFDEWSAALAFPAYFGRNWDALDECLAEYLVIERGGLGSEFGDRPGVPADTMVIVVGAASAVLADEPARLRGLISICRDAASGRGWAPRRRQLARLRVIWQAEPTQEAELRTRLRSAGFEEDSVPG